MDFALCFEMDTTQMSKNFDQMSIIGFQFYFVETSKSIKLYFWMRKQPQSVVMYVR